MTLVAFSKMVGACLEAADELAAKGISAEVINLRTLRPLDRDSIIASVKKTNRLVAVEEGWPQCGITAEICAIVMESATPASESALLSGRRSTRLSERRRKSPKFRRRALGDDARATRHLDGVATFGFPRRSDAFDYLDAPVERVTGADVPMAYAIPLEKMSLPQVDDIVNAALRTSDRRMYGT